MAQARAEVPGARHFYLVGLQQFRYQHRYDVVWVQWGLLYLADNDIVDFLIQTRLSGLKKEKTGRTGLVFVKENVSETNHAQIDLNDHSVART